MQHIEGKFYKKNDVVLKNGIYYVAKKSTTASPEKSKDWELKAKHELKPQISSAPSDYIRVERGEKGEKGDRGERGAPGKNGADGRDGKNGLDGRDGKNGLHGKNGADGKNGIDGKNGVNGKDGKNGTDGKDGLSIYYKWEGTKLGIRREDEAEFQFVDLKGDAAAAQAAIGGGGRTRFKDIVGWFDPNDISVDYANKIISIVGGSGAVDSVNGQTGVVVLDTGDIAAVTNKNYVTDAQLTVLNNTSGTNTGDQNLFSTIAVSGQSNVVADSTSDTLTLVAGSNITITTNAATDEITISASGGGGAPTNASYITLDANATLTDERLIAAGTGISIFDSGPGNAVTISSTITQYTNEMVDDRVAALLTAGTGIALTYNDPAGTLTIDSTVTQYTDEMAQDAVGGMVDSTLVYTDATPLLSRAALTGDVTASAGSNSTTIANSAVTLAKMADVATSTVFYRKTAGTGAPEVQTLATLKTDLGLTGTNSGDVTVTDSSEIDFTLTGQNITASIVAGSIDEAKLDASVNASLDLADSAAQSSFRTIAVSGQSDVVADSATDTLTLAAGSNITITTNAATDTITIAAAGASPAGSNKQVQFNDSGAFGGWIGTVANSIGGSSTTDNLFNLTATMPTTLTASTYATRYDFTTAGSSSQAVIGHLTTMIAGYTGSSAVIPIQAVNNVNGTGATYGASSAGADYRIANANYGVAPSVSNTTTGINVASRALCNGSSTANYGAWHSASSTKNTPALNVGTASFALNATTNCAGFFGLFDGGTSAPTFQNAALIAENGATTSDIFVARDNGTEVLVVEDGGVLNHQAAKIDKVRVVTGAGSVTVSATTDYVVIVNKSSGAATTVNLPSSPATGLIFVIKDGKGDAATNNITLTPAAGNIDGAGTYVMNQNYQSATIVYNGTQWNII